MKQIKLRTLISLSLISLATAALPSCSSLGGGSSSGTKVQAKFVSGFAGGTYESIANAMNQSQLFDFKVSTSQGSGEILDAISSNSADVGLVQLDILFEKYKTNKAIDANVRILLPLYTEEMHVLAQKSIASFSDLVGKKLCLGAEKSGTADTAKLILKVFNINAENATFEFDNVQPCLDKLLSGQVDAMFIVSGAPVDLLQKLTADKMKNIKLMPVSSTDLVKITNTYFHYRRAEIPAGTYGWQQESVNTISVVSSFVCHKDFNMKTATIFMRNFFENGEKLGPLHAKLRAFDEQTYRFYLAARTDYYHSGSVIYFQSQQVKKDYEN